MTKGTDQYEHIGRTELSELFQQAPAAIAVTRGPDHIYVTANLLYQKLFSRTEKDLLGKTVRNAFPEIDSQGVYELFDKVYASGKAFTAKEFPASFHRKSGLHEKGYYDFVMKPIKDKKGVVHSIFVHIIEVTDRVRYTHVIEQSLKKVAENERQLQIITNAMPALVSYVDKNERYRFVNKTYHEWFGKSEKQVLGATIRSIIGNSAYRKAQESIRKVLAGKAVTYDNVLNRQDGSIAYVQGEYVPDIDNLGNVRGFTIVGYDNTKRIQAEDRLKANEEQLRFMAEAMPQKIFTADPEGDWDYCNPQWSNYSGKSLAELLGTGWQGLLHHDDKKQSLKRWRHSVASGEPLEIEHRLRKADGTYRWHLCRISAMRAESGDIVMWIGSTTDVEDVKQAVQRRKELELVTAGLREQRTQLLALNNAKDEFISLASHQLRTPATGVKQYIGMLLEGFAGELSEQQQVFLQRAYDSNERQITIINDLLQVAQVDAGRVALLLEDTDIVKLVKDVLHEQADKFSLRRQSLLIKPGADSIIVKVDKNRMRMVLENIVDNAGKYTPEGKPVEVSVKIAKNSVTITVRDKGVGMNPQDIDRIFHKFSRLHNPLSLVAGGSGLGLYWAKKIVDLHGGSIKATSKPGSGSVFEVKLPIK